MTHEKKIRSGGPKIWFLPPRVSEQALSFCYPPTAMVMDHSAYLSDVSSLSKIYVPIKDNYKHWYLLCVDVKKRKLICVDPMQQILRKTIRERQIRQLANFIDWMIHEQLLDERLKDLLSTEFSTIRKLVARWQLYAEARNLFIIPPVDDTARMRLALDLVLSNYNKAKENTIDATKKSVTKIN
ncbi:hypothetical protein HN51_024787 [Arachis hypogaea]